MSLFQSYTYYKAKCSFGIQTHSGLATRQWRSYVSIHVPYQANRLETKALLSLGTLYKQRTASSSHPCVHAQAALRVQLSAVQLRTASSSLQSCAIGAQAAHSVQFATTFVASIRYDKDAIGAASVRYDKEAIEFAPIQACAISAQPSSLRQRRN